jgi:catechol 2,3-dioxygenase
VTDVLSHDASVDTNGRQIIKPRLHHFGFATTRHDELYEWYRLVIGTVRSAGTEPPLPPGSFVSNDELTHHTGAIFQMPGLVEDPDWASQTRVQHLAWEYDSLDDLLESFDRLEALGISPVVCACHRVSWAFYYKDPDNHTVELTAATYEDESKLMEQMRSPEFNPNTWWVSVDPRMMVAAHGAGATLDEMRERSIAGEFCPDPDPGQAAQM